MSQRPLTLLGSQRVTHPVGDGRQAHGALRDETPRARGSPRDVVSTGHQLPEPGQRQGRWLQELARRHDQLWGEYRRQYL